MKLSDEKIQKHREQAKADVEAAEHFIRTMVAGLKQFEFFDPGVDRLVRVATLAQMVDSWTDIGGAQVVSAVAMVLLAEVE